jgi:hypothetical protein
MLILRLLLLTFALASDEGGHLDPNGGGAMDPNGGSEVGSAIDPDGAQICYTGCIDPNG